MKMTVRKPDFQFPNLAEHYYRQSPLLTQIMNSLHVVVPVGEKFFIRSVKDFLDRATVEEKKELLAFIGQEAHHDKAHRALWETLEKQGLPIGDFERFYSLTAFETLEPLLKNIFGPELMLSVTAALEHYTAMLAEQALKPDSILLDGMDENVRSLMSWHAAEEIEHKAVVFDLLNKTDNSYALRLSGFLLASFFLHFYSLAGTGMFLLREKNLSPGGIIKDLSEFVSFSAKIFPPMVTSLLSYLRPDFHPDQHDNYHLAADYLGGNSSAA